MSITELFALAAAGRLQSLELVSLEGAIYLLHAHVDSSVHPINTDNGLILRLRSVTHARDALKGLPSKVPFFLVHYAAHTQMCGLEQGADEPLRVPISLESAW